METFVLLIFRRWNPVSIDSSGLASTPGNSSIRAAGSSFAAYRGGSARFSRPRQLDPALIDQLDGGLDPQKISEMSRATAAALLDRVRHTQDPIIVNRVLNLVETEGINLIAELWSKEDAESLPGVLWRLYTMRQWMMREKVLISRLWRAGEPEQTAASAIAGINSAPTASDIASTADSILTGAFTGDFAVALERAAAFCEVVSQGLTKVQRAQQNSLSSYSPADYNPPAARSLSATARTFAICAKKWRENSLY